jgi:hypothetical protein
VNIVSIVPGSTDRKNRREINVFKRCGDVWAEVFSGFFQAGKAPPEKGGQQGRRYSDGVGVLVKEKASGFERHLVVGVSPFPRKGIHPLQKLCIRRREYLFRFVNK